MIYVLLFVVFMILLYVLLKMRNMQIWIFSYLRNLFKKKIEIKKQKVYFCLADHYEPYFGGATKDKARGLVDKWINNYKKVAMQHIDSDGKHPKHSYFYPIEEYDSYILDKIKGICDDGLGDLDIHLHHDNDSSDNLSNTLTSFKKLLFNEHGLLRKDKNNNIVYGFIHGNWALDNSRPDGKWCGVDDEIDVLLQTGCVFDMTMPSAPSDTQTKTINSLYFAKEDGKCKSHNVGVAVKKGEWRENELLMIQGPLELNWKNRKAGVIPRIESGELSYDSPPRRERISLWRKADVTIKGLEEHIFIKLYTHGLQEKNMKMFYELNGFNDLWTYLEDEFRDKENTSLHYVSAWEMYEVIKSLTCSQNK